jgi:predicted TPR repeat methyltransferase
MTPEDILPTLKNAVALHQRGELAAAQAAYERVLAAQPEQGDALHFLGVLMHQRGRNDEALLLIRRAADLLPGHAVIQNNLGNVLQDQGDMHGAVIAYRAAVAVDSNNATTHYNLGIALERTLQLDAAIDAYRSAVVLSPDDGDAQKNLAQTLRRVGRQTEASVALSAWLDLEPGNPVAAHLLAACTGTEVPERASDAYVAETFNAAADNFDRRLKDLGYKAPELVGAALEAELGVGVGDRIVLDAGCGTGLAAPHLRPYAKRLDGVDLSAGMIARARACGLYDRLEIGELSAFLGLTPSRYDLIASVDTLVYFGRLDTVLSTVASALRFGGLLVFTLEVLTEDRNQGFELAGSGRYRHGADYLRKTLDAADLSTRRLERAALRSENGVPVSGFVVSAAKV